MSSIDGIELRIDEKTSTQGAAFPLLRQHKGAHFSHVTINAVCVDIAPNSKIIVARLCKVAKRDDVFDSAFDAVQEALDILGAYSGKFNRTCEPLEYHAEWSQGDSGLDLRVMTRCQTAFRAEGQLVGVNAAGGETLPKQPTRHWQPAFRYLRFARTGTYPVDCFRNDYLCLEHILARLSNPNGNHANHHTDLKWLKTTVKLLKSDYSITDDQALNDIYQLRNDVFHAKATYQNAVLPPRGSYSHSIVRRIEKFLPALGNFVYLGFKALKLDCQSMGLNPLFWHPIAARIWNDTFACIIPRGTTVSDNEACNEMSLDVTGKNVSGLAIIERINDRHVRVEYQFQAWGSTDAALLDRVAIVDENSNIRSIFELDGTIMITHGDRIKVICDHALSRTTYFSHTDIDSNECGQP